MSAAPLLTAEQFAEQLPDLPDGGRWVELEAGEIVTLEPPNEVHGNIVLNFSKALGAYLSARRREPVGYACFEIGLVVLRQPDTVHRPAVSFFSRKTLFEETDRFITETVPEVVIEAATTAARRRFLPSRIERYFAFGVRQVWVIDPAEQAVHFCETGRTTRLLGAGRTLTGEPFLPGFAVPVSQLFAEPEWWRAPLRRP